MCVCVCVCVFVNVCIVYVNDWIMILEIRLRVSNVRVLVS